MSPAVAPDETSHPQQPLPVPAPALAPLDPETLRRLGGLSEVSRVLGRSTNVVCTWVRRPPRGGFVAPVHAVAATKLWDLEAVRAWGRENPRLVGEGFTG